MGCKISPFRDRVRTLPNLEAVVVSFELVLISRLVASRTELREPMLTRREVHQHLRYTLKRQGRL